jgi:hypothetical protein
MGGGEGWGRWVREWEGKGEEMTQTLYAYMNKRKKKTWIRKQHE